MSMLSAGLSVVGGVVGAAGAMQEAQAVAASHEYNAAVAERNQKVIAQQTHQVKKDTKLDNRREKWGIRAKYAANNLGMTGSAMDVMADSMRTQALNVRRIEYKGQLLELEQEDTATLELMSASAARTAGTISAASSILGGLGGAANILTRA
jgi:hypothetical protein